MEHVLTAEQMRYAEAASDKLGVSLWTLMKNAGAALARQVEKTFTEISGNDVTIVCGSGNNGGDGLVCAKILAESGYGVTVFLAKGEPKSELAKKAFAGLPDSVLFSEDFKAFDTDIAIDCVFGTGFHGELDEKTKELFTALNSSRAYKIACDMPSGVNCRNGLVSDGTVRFDKTVTFHAVKLGMCLKPAKSYCGEVTVCDIGIPDNWDGGCPDGTVIREYTASVLHELLPDRPEYSHKGTFGKLLLICGSERYIGAAAVCSKAALRSGCGIVNLAAPKFVIGAVAGNAPECVYTPIEPDDAEYTDKLVKLANKHDAVVVGYGIGQTEITGRLIEALVKNVQKPLLIDADGINQLAKNIDILKDKCLSSEIILTPHIAELSRLCGCTVSEAVENRYTLCREFTEKYNVTLHSKDASSVTCKNGEMYITSFGNSALAKGGSGDMLAGVAGSVLAQGISPEKAIMLADYIVGGTAELLSERYSPAAITASDIIGYFGISLNEL